jgi:hypothetical protein
LERFTPNLTQTQTGNKALMKVKEGEAVAAMYRHDIRFYWYCLGENNPETNKGFGLKHIIEKTR